MRLYQRAILASAVALFAGVSRADVTATVNHLSSSDATDAFKFDAVPVPATDDLATAGKFTVVEGEKDDNAADLSVLNDGKAAENDDQPSTAFFFAEHTVGGRLKLDLGAVKEIGQINTYSWHTDTRAPQVYKVYVADGTEDGFDADPKMFVDPALVGWTLLASVDTRKGGGGQYGVSVGDGDGVSMGKAQYVLFDISRTESDDTNGNTFFNEIDVVAPDKMQLLKTADGTTQPAGKYKIVIDTTGLSDEMKTWATAKLEPVCREWYPKLVEMLPSDGFTAPRTFTIVFKNDMGGTPAAAQGNRVMCNLPWFEKNKDGEGVGAVVHEMVHVVQQYKFGRKSVPFWLQEGIPDYIRWYLYEPEKNGARIRDVSKASYDGAYRVSANFLNWATATYDKDLVKKLNAIVRQGKYNENTWTDLTGKTLDESNTAWKESLTKK